LQSHCKALDRILRGRTRGTASVAKRKCAKRERAEGKCQKQNIKYKPKTKTTNERGCKDAISDCFKTKEEGDI